MDISDTSHPRWRRYAQLREQLHTAYTAAVWDSQRIDRIAAQMVLVEQALATGRPLPPSPGCADGAPHTAPENLVRLSAF